ncbi:hypothetical protein B0H16DRAFT_1816139 [Mycena metata]|uniref:Uncharacterized protein n=1 Tax=Mycena metata TaxID=1033252 RepID=A0AAD7NGR6_9AGAR|nr:hypothetical protein B0H16DRAFT_1816139 [Mycena metata]
MYGKGRTSSKFKKARDVEGVRVEVNVATLGFEGARETGVRGVAIAEEEMAPRKVLSMGSGLGYSFRLRAERTGLSWICLNGGPKFLPTLGLARFRSRGRAGKGLESDEVLPGTSLGEGGQGKCYLGSGTRLRAEKGPAHGRRGWYDAEAGVAWPPPDRPGTTLPSLLLRARLADAHSADSKHDGLSVSASLHSGSHDSNPRPALGAPPAQPRPRPARWGEGAAEWGGAFSIKEVEEGRCAEEGGSGSGSASAHAHPRPRLLFRRRAVQRSAPSSCGRCVKCFVSGCGGGGGEGGKERDARARLGEYERREDGALCTRSSNPRRAGGGGAVSKRAGQRAACSVSGGGVEVEAAAVSKTGGKPVSCLGLQVLRSKHLRGFFGRRAGVLNDWIGRASQRAACNVSGAISAHTSVGLYGHARAHASVTGGRMRPRLWAQGAVWPIRAGGGASRVESRRGAGAGGGVQDGRVRLRQSGAVDVEVVRVRRCKSCCAAPGGGVLSKRGERVESGERTRSKEVVSAARVVDPSRGERRAERGARRSMCPSFLSPRTVLCSAGRIHAAAILFIAHGRLVRRAAPGGCGCRGCRTASRAALCLSFEQGDRGGEIVVVGSYVRLFVARYPRTVCTACAASALEHRGAGRKIVCLSRTR